MEISVNNVVRVQHMLPTAGEVGERLWYSPHPLIEGVDQMAIIFESLKNRYCSCF